MVGWMLFQAVDLFCVPTASELGTIWTGTWLDQGVEAGHTIHN